MVGGRYGTADEPRRLRNPDLSRVDSSPSAGHWQPSEKSASYRYGSPGSGQYADYFKPDTRPHVVESDLPSGQFASSSRENSQRRVKTYGPESADGRIRDGLTEARSRKPAEEKNTGQGCHL